MSTKQSSSADAKEQAPRVSDAASRNLTTKFYEQELLSMIPYEDLTPEQIVLPQRQEDTGYVRPPKTGQRFVPEVY